MLKKNYKGRCERRTSPKVDGVCRFYSKIQSAYADKLDADETVVSYQVNVLLDGLELGDYTSDEGLLQSIDVSPKNADVEANAETNSAPVSKNDLVPQKTDELTREELKKCVKNFMQLIMQQEATKKEFTSAIDRLIAEKEKQQSQTALTQTDIEYSGSIKNKDAEMASLWKRVIKSEKENAVLKTQLEAEKREAALKHEAAMEMKRVEMEHLKKQMDIYISSLEELRKENETLLQENEELKHKSQSIRYEQIQSRLGILRNQNKRKSMKAIVYLD